MRNSGFSNSEIVKCQGANALIAATIGFLDANNISKRQIVNSVRKYYDSRKEAALDSTGGWREHMKTWVLLCRRGFRQQISWMGNAAPFLWRLNQVLDPSIPWCAQRAFRYRPHWRLN